MKKTTKKENGLIIFIKGFVIGLGVIFPGSASALAIVMGLYERILYIINNFTKAIKTDLKFIIMLILGIVASCITGCLLLDYTLNKYPIATLLFFIGLILGGFPSIVKKTNKEYKPFNIGLFVIGLLIIGAISFISNNSDVSLELSFISLLKLFAVGLIGGGSMMVPGMSGSVMLVILGYYTPMLAVIKNACHFTNLAYNITLGAVFAIGMLLGIIILSKIMDHFIQKHETPTYFLITGFICASTLEIIISLFSYSFNLIELLIGILLFIGGFIVSFKYLKEE